MNLRLTGVGMTSPRTRARLVEKLRSLGIRDEVVLDAINSVPRHVFVDEALASRAYDNDALPIGHQQTISQPYIVARTAELLRAGSRPLNKVLEVGGGCGYQAAVLGQLAREVYSVERIEALQKKAVLVLREIGARNVVLTHADGQMGRPELAPFDGIVFAAAARHVPESLLNQLAVGGRMVVPLGTTDQVLTLIERTERGFTSTALEPANFVPVLAGRS